MSSVKVLGELMNKLTISKEASEIKEASASLATFLNGRIEDDVPQKTVADLEKGLASKKDAAAREKSLIAIESIARHSEISAHVDPFLVALLPAVLNAVGDKVAAVKDAATAAAVAIAEAINPNAVKIVLPALGNSLVNAQKWQEKMVALDFLDILVRTAPTQMSVRVPDLIPVVSESMWDTKKEVGARFW